MGGNTGKDLDKESDQRAKEGVKNLSFLFVSKILTEVGRQYKGHLLELENFRTHVLKTYSHLGTYSTFDNKTKLMEEYIFEIINTINQIYLSYIEDIQQRSLQFIDEMKALKEEQPNNKTSQELNQDIDTSPGEVNRDPLPHGSASLYRNLRRDNVNSIPRNPFYAEEDVSERESIDSDSQRDFSEAGSDGSISVASEEDFSLDSPTKKNKKPRFKLSNDKAQKIRALREKFKKNLTKSLGAIKNFLKKSFEDLDEAIRSKWESKKVTSQKLKKLHDELKQHLKESAVAFKDDLRKINLFRPWSLVEEFIDNPRMNFLTKRYLREDFYTSLNEKPEKEKITRKLAKELVRAKQTDFDSLVVSLSQTVPGKNLLKGISETLKKGDSSHYKRARLLSETLETILEALKKRNPPPYSRDVLLSNIISPKEKLFTDESNIEAQKTIATCLQNYEQLKYTAHSNAINSIKEAITKCNEEIEKMNTKASTTPFFSSSIDKVCKPIQIESIENLVEKAKNTKGSLEVTYEAIRKLAENALNPQKTSTPDETSPEERKLAGEFARSANNPFKKIMQKIVADAYLSEELKPVSLKTVPREDQTSIKPRS